MRTKDQPAISVIVPVYNAEKYLRRCLDSISLQSFQDFEAILIDDGSIDGSREICDEFCKRDFRFKVYHQENAGVSSARQLGIEKAKGLYSIHADSDDWMESIALERMYEAIDSAGADCLICDFKVDYRESIMYRKQLPSSLTSDGIVRSILRGSVHGATWNKLVRHSRYNQGGVEFPKGINYCEDVLAWIDWFWDEAKITYLPEAYYHYDQTNEESITRNYRKETLNQRLLFVASLVSKLNKEKYHDEILQSKLSVMHEAFAHGILAKSDYEGLFPEVRKRDCLRLNASLISRWIFFLSRSGAYLIARKLFLLIKFGRSML